MATYKKIPLSGSTHGRGIKVTQTAIGSGDTIHTAEATTTDGEGDTVTIEAYNSDTVQRILTLGWGGTTSPDDLMTFPLPSQAGLILCVADLFLRNALVVKAAADVANKVVVFGSVITAVP